MRLDQNNEYNQSSPNSNPEEANFGVSSALSIALQTQTNNTESSLGALVGGSSGISGMNMNSLGSSTGTDFVVGSLPMHLRRHRRPGESTSLSFGTMMHTNMHTTTDNNREGLLGGGFIGHHHRSNDGGVAASLPTHLGAPFLSSREGPTNKLASMPEFQLPESIASSNQALSSSSVQVQYGSLRESRFHSGVGASSTSSSSSANHQKLSSSVQYYGSLRESRYHRNNNNNPLLRRGDNYLHGADKEVTSSTKTTTTTAIGGSINPPPLMNSPVVATATGGCNGIGIQSTHNSNLTSSGNSLQGGSSSSGIGSSLLSRKSELVSLLVRDDDVDVDDDAEGITKGCHDINLHHEGRRTTTTDNNNNMAVQLNNSNNNESMESSAAPLSSSLTALDILTQFSVTNGESSSSPRNNATFGETMISNEMHAATFAPPQQQYAVTENTSFYDNDDDRDSNPDMFEAFDLDLDE
mmetsp:Transcript_27492/g.50037  ORF Transcript_27492/g.50037 Transcript_27492/m.50037 type:complete len:468 (+) Transcript_27492:76-1479(+)